MRPYQVVCIVAVAALLLLEATPADAKRRKHKGSDYHHEKSDPHKTKTKTKWSSSTDLAGSTQVSTEEHGYYVKRTYAAPGENGDGQKRLSPPYLAIPIAWFSCESGQKDCQTSNSAAINSAAQSLSEGYLCDDDCNELYEPICGRTSSEVAVFYNKCKLGVAKCRSHGLWSDFAYSECQEKYPQETAYADKKFRSSPYFRDAAIVEQLKLEEEKRKQEEEKRKLEKEQKKREKAEKKKKDKESSESSEEKEDQKQKDEVQLPTLTLQKPVETPQIPVPVAIHVAIPKPTPVLEPAKTTEDIALPPMPLKDTPTPKPLEIAPLKEQTQPRSQDINRLKYHVA
ncbi:MAP7 domain-containing protein 2 [Drosophila subpulchrella]|uniref:MAP7 domain-containing protein 2 n=1 Tax=Drosophila subpulchrella TaxID=1486046 RepID=UPI0018A19612|nr:MAP7 domain-containing protein 2 [Drosophila subpulchrella]